MDASTIIFIHEYLTQFFLDKDDPINPPGVKNLSTVESAAARPNATAGGYDAYPTPFLKAAALFHSIAGNHSFHNGNKRAALLATLYYLSELGYWVDKCDDDEMYEFTRRVAAHEIASERNAEVPLIAEWLERNSVKQQAREESMMVDALRESLGHFELELSDHRKTIEALRDGKVVTSVLKNGNQGIGTARVYGRKSISDELNLLMEERLDVMNRLAKI